MNDWLRHIGPILYRRRGEPTVLLKALERLEPHGQEALFRVLRDFEDDLHRAEHTYRPFPGGPRIRI